MRLRAPSAGLFHLRPNSVEVRCRSAASAGYEETAIFSGFPLERAKGFEPSTPTLARLCSTPELRPRSYGREIPGRTSAAS
jgi:hypothetical protein